MFNIGRDKSCLSTCLKNVIDRVPKDRAVEHIFPILQEIIVNTILTVLAICSLIVAVSFLLERSDWSRYESYRLMIGTAVSLSTELLTVLVTTTCKLYKRLG